MILGIFVFCLMLLSCLMILFGEFIFDLKNCTG